MESWSSHHSPHRHPLAPGRWGTSPAAPNGCLLTAAPLVWSPQPWRAKPKLGLGLRRTTQRTRERARICSPHIPQSPLSRPLATQGDPWRFSSETTTPDWSSGELGGAHSCSPPPAPISSQQPFVPAGQKCFDCWYRQTCFG